VAHHPRIAVDDLTFDEANLAPQYLDQSVRAFLSIGDARLAGGGPTGQQDLTALAARMVDRRRMLLERLASARSAVLFAALAVEAAANYYIARAVPPVEGEAIDRMPTVQKLLVAPRLATGTALFEPAKAPLGETRRLFKTRDRIVHPKVGGKSVVRLGDPDFDPSTVAGMVIAAAEVLVTLYGAVDQQAGIAPAVVAKGKAFRAFGKRWSEPVPPSATVIARALAEVDPGA
jgi:hypothetical protein